MEATIEDAKATILTLTASIDELTSKISTSEVATLSLSLHRIHASAVQCIRNFYKVEY